MWTLSIYRALAFSAAVVGECLSWLFVVVDDDDDGIPSCRLIHENNVRPQVHVLVCVS